MAPWDKHGKSALLTLKGLNKKWGIEIASLSIDKDLIIKTGDWILKRDYFSYTRMHSVPKFDCEYSRT